MEIELQAIIKLNDNEYDEKWYEINDYYYYEIYIEEVISKSNTIILFYEKYNNIQFIKQLKIIYIIIIFILI